MQGWVKEERAAGLHAAVRKDITLLLVTFVSTKESKFDMFKKVWSDLGMSRLHHLCPKFLVPPFFLQLIHQNG